MNGELKRFYNNSNNSIKDEYFSKFGSIEGERVKYYMNGFIKEYLYYYNDKAVFHAVYDSLGSNILLEGCAIAKAFVHNIIDELKVNDTLKLEIIVPFPPDVVVEASFSEKNDKCNHETFTNKNIKNNNFYYSDVLKETGQYSMLTIVKLTSTKDTLVSEIKNDILVHALPLPR